jgi:transposase-like protein
MPKNRNHTALIETASTHTRYNYAELARRLGVSRQLLNKWKQQNAVPKKYWRKFERVTKKAILASYFN